MGTIINLGKTNYTWDREKGCDKYENKHNGLKLTNAGWKNFDIIKHRRDTGRWGRQNTCNVCGGKCYQSFGGKWEQICIKCSTEWLTNSIEELDKIKAKLEEQKKLIAENMTDMMIKERLKLDEWAKMDILDKLESEQ